MSLEGGPATKVIDSVRGRVFTPTERGIFFASGQVASELRFLDFASGAVRTIGPGSPVISPDGNWALYEHNERTGTNLILVENFR